MLGIRVGYGQIPYNNNREFFERNTEITSPFREIFECNRAPEMSAKLRSASSCGDGADAVALATGGERQDAHPVSVTAPFGTTSAVNSTGLQLPPWFRQAPNRLPVARALSD